MCLFFFKQKAAYEVRISDWSSDVCSSDLLVDDVQAVDARDEREGTEVARGIVELLREEQRLAIEPAKVLAAAGGKAGRRIRSEEHTSELQSLMRISYAVFCLQKKNSLKKEGEYKR